MGVLNLVSLALLVIGSNAVYASKVKNLNITAKDEYMVPTRNKWNPLISDSIEMQSYHTQGTEFNEDFENSALLQIKLLDDEPQNSPNNKLMQIIIDIVFKNIYSMVIKERPDLKYVISDKDKFNPVKITLDMFPCYRSVLNKISNTCFSLSENPYTTKWLFIFADFCIADKQIHQMVNQLVDVACVHLQKLNIKNIN